MAAGAIFVGWKGACDMLREAPAKPEHWAQVDMKGQHYLKVNGK